MTLKIRGKRHWRWRAVDQDGVVPDILVQERRDQTSAERFLRCVLQSCEYQIRSRPELHGLHYLFTSVPPERPRFAAPQPNATRCLNRARHPDDIDRMRCSTSLRER